MANPGIAANIVSGDIYDARNHQQQGYGEAINAAQKYYEQALGYQQPWNDYGVNALNDFKTWSSNPNAITSDPSYQWRRNQGTNALENSAAARGGLLSGNTAKGITDYAQNAASQEYQNEFNRWMAKLGIGQNAASNMSNISTGEGHLLANLYTGQGNAYQNATMQGLAEARNAETGLNSIIQSWMPASFGGGGSGGSGASGMSSGATSGFSSGMGSSAGSAIGSYF